MVRTTKGGKRRPLPSRWPPSSGNSESRKRAVKKDWRRRGREAALQILYQWDLGRADIDVTIDTFFDLQWPDLTPPPEALRAFAAALARDTVAQLGVIDGFIAETAENWRPERMGVLDRLVLRMAVCELLRDAAE